MLQARWEPSPLTLSRSVMMNSSALKRQGLAVFEDQGGAGTRIRRAGSSTTGIDRHAGPTDTRDQRDARG